MGQKKIKEQRHLDRMRLSIEDFTSQNPPSPVTLHRSEVFQGPLPHPEMLAQYDRVNPNASSIILGEFVKEGDSRRKLARDTIYLSTSLKLLGLLSSLLINGFFLYAAYNLAMNGRTFEGLAAVAVPTITLLLTLFSKKDPK